MKKDPSFYPNMDKLTSSQRHNLRAGDYVRRVRDQHEASSITVANSTTSRNYRTGDGDVLQSQRPGSDLAYGLPSRGAK